MSKQEKLLLLEMLMRDMRGSFPMTGASDKRIKATLRLASELELTGLVDETYEWLDAADYYDGRFFRGCDYNYDVVAEMHELKYTYEDKSEEFKDNVCHLLEYPQFLFEDYEGDDYY